MGGKMKEEERNTRVNGKGEEGRERKRSKDK